MADNQEPEPILLHEDTHKKDLISILGTQGLMYNDFNAAEYKLLMLIIKHNQKVIKQYIVPANLQHGHLPFTKEQFQAGHVDIVIPFKEFGYNRSNNLWLKDKLCQMAKKPIDIPYKMNDTTYHKHFGSLFTPDCYRLSDSSWVACLHFDYELMQYLFAFDKGVAHIDLNAMGRMHSVATRKMYVFLHCWAARGYTSISPTSLMLLLKGREAYQYFGDLEAKQLLTAQQELKSLFDKSIIDEYFTYKPFYQAHIKKAMPDHISFTLHNRKYVEPTEEMMELQAYWQLQLKVKLIYTYGVEEKTAIDLSLHMRTDYVGELHDWFLHKDYFIAQQILHHKPMNKAAYIVGGLRGFFHDKETSRGNHF